MPFFVSQVKCSDLFVYDTKILKRNLEKKLPPKTLHFTFRLNFYISMIKVPCIESP